MISFACDDCGHVKVVPLGKSKERLPRGWEQFRRWIICDRCAARIDRAIRKNVELRFQNSPIIEDVDEILKREGLPYEAGVRESHAPGGDAVSDDASPEQAHRP